MKMNDLLLVIAFNKNWHGSLHCMELYFYMTNNKTFKPFLESKLYMLLQGGSKYQYKYIGGLFSMLSPIYI